MTEKNFVTAEKFSKKGRALTSDGKREIPGALPLEEVLAEQAGRKLAFLREVVRPSKTRVEPKCAHVPDCGGCAFQQLDYQAQLVWKEERVKDLFTPLMGKATLHPIIGCDTPWQYRNKMEFSFSQNREGTHFLGLMRAGGKGRVENITKCHLVSDWFSEVLNAVRSWWLSSHLRAYHHRSDQGHLRTLTLREAQQGKGKMAMLTISGNPEYALSKKEMARFVEAVRTVYDGEDLSVFVQVHQITKGRPTEFFEMRLHGPDHITEVLHIDGRRMEFKISPTSFFQPNTLQAEKIFSRGLGLLQKLDGAFVFDLYCGGATLGLSAAARAKEVIGIEINPHSVFDAGWNMEVNQVENFSIHRGDVGEVLKKIDVSPDVVILDPPRSGLSPGAIEQLNELAPEEILYVSCNPKTQAEDVQQLLSLGFYLKEIQPVDQFPHTVHLENICILQKS